MAYEYAPSWEGSDSKTVPLASDILAKPDSDPPSAADFGQHSDAFDRRSAGQRLKVRAARWHCGCWARLPVEETSEARIGRSVDSPGRDNRQKCERPRSLNPACAPITHLNDKLWNLEQ